MVNNERLPSVRVEVEGLASTDLDAPEVDYQGGGPSSSALAGVVTLAVLLVIGAALVVLSSNGGAEPENAQDGFLPEETITEEFELAANGGDFHLSIARSINAKQESQRVTVRQLQASTDFLRRSTEQSRTYPTSLDLVDEEAWSSHDKLGFLELAQFEGKVLLGDQELFLFSDVGSLSAYNRETDDWATVTSPAFTDADVRTDGWVAADGPRWYSIDYTKLTIVDLIEVDGTIETVETTVTITMSEEGLRSLDSAEILWASLDIVIFATGDTSWIVNVPEAPLLQAAGSQ